MNLGLSGLRLLTYLENQSCMLLIKPINIMKQHLLRKMLPTIKDSCFVFQVSALIEIITTLSRATEQKSSTTKIHSNLMVNSTASHPAKNLMQNTNPLLIHNASHTKITSCLKATWKLYSHHPKWNTLRRRVRGLNYSARRHGLN